MIVSNVDDDDDIPDEWKEENFVHVVNNRAVGGQFVETDTWTDDVISRDPDVALWNDVIVEEDSVDASIVESRPDQSPENCSGERNIELMLHSFDPGDAGLDSFDGELPGEPTQAGNGTSIQSVPLFPVISKRLVLVQEESLDSSNLFMDSLMPHPVAGSVGSGSSSSQLINLSFEPGNESIIEDSLDPRPHFNLDHLDKQGWINPGDVSSLEDELSLQNGNKLKITPAEPEHPNEVVHDDEAEESLASFIRKEKEFEKEEMDLSSSTGSLENEVDEEADEVQDLDQDPQPDIITEQEQDRDAGEELKPEAVVEQEPEPDQETELDPVPDHPAETEQEPKLESEPEQDEIPEPQQEQILVEVVEQSHSPKLELEVEHQLEADQPHHCGDNLEPEHPGHEERIQDPVQVAEIVTQLQPESAQDELSDESSSPSSSCSSLVQQNHSTLDDQTRALNPKRYYFPDETEPFLEPKNAAIGPDLIPEATSGSIAPISHETSPVVDQQPSRNISSPVETRPTTQPATEGPATARVTSPRPEPAKLTDSIQLVRAPENPDRARSCSPNSSSIPVRDIAKLFEKPSTTSTSLKSAAIWKSMPDLSKPPVKATTSCPPNGQPDRIRNVRVVSSAIPANEQEVCTIVPIKERKRLFEGLAESENRRR